ncbi:MAG: transposase, partial [Polyangiaceae bacterium]
MKVREFMVEAVAAGTVEPMVDAVIHLLARMRDINHELVRRDMARRRAKPPSETSRRLQQELLFSMAPANENGTADAGEASKAEASDGAADGAESAAAASSGAAAKAAELLNPKKRGPKKRDEHGRGELPAHLERVPNECLVSDAERTCPHCHVEAERVAFRASEVLELSPARFIVRRDLIETVSCPGCREYIVSAERADMIIPRGLLGPDLVVQAMVEHYGEAVSYERMERRAEEQGVPLRANTLARNVSRLVDLLDPIVDEIARRVGRSTDLALDATS